MKTLFFAALLLHVVIESLVGLALIFAPEMLVPNASDLVIQGLTNLGCLALASVATIFWLWPRRTQEAALFVGLATLASFHSFVLISAVISGTLFQSFVGFVHHIALMLCFWLLFFRRFDLSSAVSNTFNN